MRINYHPRQRLQFFNVDLDPNAEPALRTTRRWRSMTNGIALRGSMGNLIRDRAVTQLQQRWRGQRGQARERTSRYNAVKRMAAYGRFDQVATPRRANYVVQPVTRPKKRKFPIPLSREYVGYNKKYVEPKQRRFMRENPDWDGVVVDV